MDAGAPSDGKRQGRGRLSSIDMLPEEAEPDIVWANERLEARDMPQTAILAELNARLADKGIKGISKGAFSRHSVKAAVEFQNIAQSVAITNLLLARLPASQRSDTLVAATELMKHRIIEMVLSADKSDMKLIDAATKSMQRVATIAEKDRRARQIDRIEQREDDDRAAKKDAEARKEAAEQDAATIEKLATEAGLSAEKIAAIRRGVLGLAT